MGLLMTRVDLENSREVYGRESDLSDRLLKTRQACHQGTLWEQRWGSRLSQAGGEPRE